MHSSRLLFLTLIALLIWTGPLTACGKKAPLDPVPGGSYPRTYPGE